MIEVLCVDDEESFLDLEKALMERTGGISVDTARSVPEALERLKVRGYDAIVSDYQMPGPTGLDLLRFLRAAGNHVPFILFTGRGEDSVAIEAMTEGATFYVEKGSGSRSTFTEIVNMIRIAAGGKEAEDKARKAEVMCNSVCSADSSVVFVLDESGRIRDCSDSVHEVLGYDKEDLVGRICSELVAGTGPRDPADAMGELASIGIAQVTRLNLMRKDRTPIPVAISSVAVSSGRTGNLSGSLYVVRDLSRDENTEAELRVMRRRCADLEETLDDICDASDPEQKYKDAKKAS